MGHCLWSGIVDDEHAEAVADRLMSRDDVERLGHPHAAPRRSRAYDPMSYHCGTVWPHDGALVRDGLAPLRVRRGGAEIADGLLAASDAWHGRLPELFCGFDRRDVGTPVPFPTSCSPQAWAAASPFLLLRMLLGLEPDGKGMLAAAPMPGATDQLDDLSWSGLRCGDDVYDVRVDDGIASVTAR